MSDCSTCVRIKGSRNITISGSDIGPCGVDSPTRSCHYPALATGGCEGLGVLVADSSAVELSDSYIHSEYRPTNQSFDPKDRRWSHGIDRGDSIFVTNSHSVLVAGCVVAFGESNLENHASTDVTVEGNFFLNPLGPAPRGNQVQTWGDPEHCMPQSGGSEAKCNSRNTAVRFNVALTKSI